MSQTEEIHRLLAGIRENRKESLDALFGIVYQDLRRIAQHHLRGNATGTLGTTAMVNEVYLRLAGADGSWEDRKHFFVVASMAMRQILVSDARRKLSQKRGGGAGAVELEDHHAQSDPQVLELLQLDEALMRLGEINERLVRVVELRYFAELSLKETADVLGVAERTVGRDWRTARAYLHDAIGGVG